jgi:hypothetical protein
MLRLVHTVWSRNSHMYGYSYDIAANSTLVHNIENDTTKFTAIELQMLGDLTKASHLDCQNRTDIPVPEVSGADPMTKISLHGTPWGSDSRRCVDSAPKLANDPLKMHEKFEICGRDVHHRSRRAHSTEMTANFRMWSRESGRDLFLSTSNYMDKRFGKTRIPGADKHTVVNGYKGVRISRKPICFTDKSYDSRTIPIRDVRSRVTFKSRQI